MKRINKLFYFLLGVLVFSGISVYATTTLLSKNVTFTPQNTNWQVSNVETALNNLHKQVDNLTAPSHTVTWCCGDDDKITLFLIDSAWKYITFKDGGGTSSYRLVFHDDSMNVLANILLDQKYEINSMPSRRIYLSCGSTDYKCFKAVYSK